MKAKHIIAAILAALTVSAAAVSLTACGGSNGSSSTADPSTTSSAAASSAAASTASGKYATVEEFVNSAEVQKQLESVKGSVKSMGLEDVRFKAEGNALVYEYQCAENESDYMREHLNTQMNSESGVTTFTNIVKELKSKTAISDPVVIVRYLNKDGSVLAEKTYTENTVASSAETSSAAASSNQTSSEKTMSYATAAEYVNAPETQDEVRLVQEQLGSQGLDVDFSAEGNDVVVTINTRCR